LFLLVSCGGTPFEGTAIDGGASTLTDAHQEPFQVDTQVDGPPLADSGANISGEGEASVSVEASAEGGAALDAGSDTGPVEASVDAANEPFVDVADAPEGGPPTCPASELWPTYSPTCDMWGQSQGWTLQGCCLPDHTCGTVRDLPQRGCYR
jgi:hypothetical protein